MKLRNTLLFIIILNTSILYGQILSDTISHKHILSAQFSPKDFELGYPILSQKNESVLRLSFDLMGNTQPALAYRIIHCDAKWKASKILTQDYLNNSFNKFYIDDYDFSLSTKRLYTHYETIVSKAELKLSGNYVVQVFPEDDEESLWLQQRFVYAESLVEISGEATSAHDGKDYKTHQRVQFKVVYDKNIFSQPRTNFTAIISQNFRWDNAQILKPLFVSNGLLSFNYIDKKGKFIGNYEFPYFDTSNILNSSHTVRTLEQDENKETQCYLYPNETAANNYFYLRDMNGNFSLKADNTFNTNTEADYVWVHFTLVSEELPSSVFVVGRFNQWKTSATNRLLYDKDLGIYHIALLLKQGVYNYTFVTKRQNGQLNNLLGNYSETENDYYIFIYYKDERLQTDRLVGFRRINTSER